MKLHPLCGSVGLYLSAFPVSYLLNCQWTREYPFVIAAAGFGALLLLFAVVYLQRHSRDPLFYVFMVYSFNSGMGAVIALEQDGYISNFMESYIREGEPQLRTAHGVMTCYWEAVVHYTLYLSMIVAIVQRKSYRHLGLYWVGSLTMNLLVFLLGSLIGKYGTESGPAFLVNVPYLLMPIWAGTRIFTQPKTSPLVTADKISEEQQKDLLQRPLDLGLVAFLLFAVIFTLFRGLVVLDCPVDSCFDYVYQQEPYLRDPVAYPKIQMLAFLFYALPYFCACLYGLLSPGCSWMPDWALVFAGAIAQAQFAHVASSLHHRTPFPYRTPEGAWWSFVLSNIAYAVGPHLLAFRCLRCPAFFCPVVSRDKIKKTQ